MTLFDRLFKYKKKWYLYVPLLFYFININVFDRELLEKAMQEPENYPQLTIRVSGYAVNFVKLSKAHQKEVIKRTFYQAV